MLKEFTLNYFHKHTEQMINTKYFLIKKKENQSLGWNIEGEMVQELYNRVESW